MAISSEEVVGHQNCFHFESCYLNGGALKYTLNDACVSVCTCRLILLSAQCQGGVNGPSAISGAQLVYRTPMNTTATTPQPTAKRMFAY